jgi:hypothetical protein
MKDLLNQTVILLLQVATVVQVQVALAEMAEMLEHLRLVLAADFLLTVKGLALLVDCRI